MQRLLAVSLSLFALYILGCKTATEPIPPGPPATAPLAGAQFVYRIDAQHHDGTGACVLTERDTVLDANSSSFSVSRSSDTIGGLTTTATNHYLVLASGDLSATYDCGCDTLPLPISSHRSFDPHPDGLTTPTKLNGFVDQNSKVYLHSQFEGEETVAAADSSFRCTKVSETTTLVQHFPLATKTEQVDTTVLIHRWWYSYDLHFFVKDQVTISSTSDSAANTMVFTRTLISYR